MCENPDFKGIEAEMFNGLKDAPFSPYQYGENLTAPLKKIEKCIFVRYLVV